MLQISLEKGPEVASIPQECSGQPTPGHQQKCRPRDRLGTPTEPISVFAMVRKTILQDTTHMLASVVVFHLSWHDLSVDATDVDASIQASLVVGVNYVTPERLVSTDTAVVRTLNTDNCHVC